ncbi:MAG TPA: hypothetical protein EYQ24_15815 [Bacteroidetes bacterium]|nr:hypothetical protein [Bacteroidota bacterium]HIL56660.1 hypothetical protein [Rhodothermales bacterium]
MTHSVHAVARPGWAAAFLLMGLLGLSACRGGPEADDEPRPAVSYESVAALRAEGAARFLTTDAELAELETAVAALDSSGQAAARPRLDALRGARSSLQSRLDSLDATRFASLAAFDTLAADLRQRIDALDAAIARDRVLILPDAASLRAYAAARLSAVAEAASRRRADSTRSAIREAAGLDSARVQIERQLTALGSPTVRYDSLRDVIAVGFADLRRLQRDTLAARFRPDSLR